MVLGLGAHLKPGFRLSVKWFLFYVYMVNKK